MAADRELCVEILNQPGALGAVSEVLGRHGINIDGFGVWDDVARLLVADVDRSLEILRGEGFACHTNEVLRLDLPDEPGNLSELARELGAGGINLDHASPVTPRDGGAAAFVLSVIDPRAAAKTVVTPDGS